MKKCNSCINQEKLIYGDLVCQHVQSIKGLEVLNEYVRCDEIDECEYYSQTKNNFTCSQCDDNCFDRLLNGKCPKQ